MKSRGAQSRARSGSSSERRRILRLAGEEEEARRGRGGGSRGGGRGTWRPRRLPALLALTYGQLSPLLPRAQAHGPHVRVLDSESGDFGFWPGLDDFPVIFTSTGVQDPSIACAWSVSSNLPQSLLKTVVALPRNGLLSFPANILLIWSSWASLTL